MSEGVRKVSEYIIKDGRALIITDSSVPIANVPAGTLYIDPDIGSLQIKLRGGENWTKPSPTDMFEPLSIPNSLIADRSIISTKLALNAVETNNIKDSAVTTAKIKDLSISTIKIIDDSISTLKIKNESVTGEKIAKKAITNELLNDACVDSRTIANDSVTTIKIKDAAITSSKLAENSVGEKHIIDGSITINKIKNGTISTSILADYSVTNIKIGSLAVNTRTIEDRAVTTAKILGKNITQPLMADNSIGVAQIINNSVTSIKILDGAITTAKLATKSVGKFQIDDALTSEIERLKAYISIVSGALTMEKSVSVKGNITATGNITGAKVFNAVYNDLAEGFEIAEESMPGDIIEVDRYGRAKLANNMSKAVVGVHSDCYAQLFGASEEEVIAGIKVPVGLIGRVPVKIIGTAKVGDLVVAYKDGVGIVNNDAPIGTIIGKVIEEKGTEEIKRTLCLINSL